MKKILIILSSFIFLAAAKNAYFKEVETKKTETINTESKIQINKNTQFFSRKSKKSIPNFSLRKSVVFEENLGQVKDQNGNLRQDVLYSGTDGLMNYHLKNNGVSYQLFQVNTWKTPEHEKIAQTGQKYPDVVSLQRIDLDFIGSIPVQPIAIEELEDKTNYFMSGNEYSGAKSFNEIKYENIYQNIDLRYYGSDEKLKYDWIVKPGGDYKKIKIKISGATPYLTNEGNVHLQTPTGTIQDLKPIAFQQGRVLESKWEIKGDTLTFDVNGYDPTKELIIDPLTRVWGTYYGGTNSDYGNEVCTDASGNVYMVGYTYSTGNIATVGAYQTVIALTPDAFLVKFNSSGVRQWGTYYGGSSTDYGQGCCCDPSGNVYLVGYTYSTGMATVGSFQAALSAGPDAFLVKFNTLGTRLWATYYGGTLTEYGETCQCDASGNVYFCGRASSTAGISSAGAHQVTLAGGTDGMLVKFDPNGVRLWGTYYGGTLTDYCYGLCVDNSGNVFINGYTTSTGGISTAGAHQVATGGGADDYIAKFNTNGVRQWGTFYGGTSTDYGWGIDCDASGNVFTTGQTSSAGGIASAGSQQPAVGTTPDAYVTKFNTNGVRQWGTYLGGNNSDYGYSICTGTLGNVYVTGYVYSTNNFTTTGSFQTVLGVTPDAFLVEYNTNGQMTWGSYYGGNSSDYGYSVHSDASGAIYLCGYTFSSNQMATAGSHQSAISTTPDAFLVKFQYCDFPASPLNLSGSPTVCANTTITLNSTQTGTVNNWFNVSTGGSSLGSGTTFSTPLISVGTQTFWIQSSNSCGSSNPRTPVQVVGLASPNLQASSSPQNICLNSSITLTATSSPATFTWSTGSNSSSITESPATNTTYVVSSGSNPCVDSKTITVTVSVQPVPPSVTPSSVLICGTGSTVFTASGSSGNYVWATQLNGSPVATVNPFTTPQLTTTTTYYLAATAGPAQLQGGQTFTFTNCAATGSLGPTQAQANAAYLATNLNGSITISPQGIQNFVIPATGPYRITVIGAKGYGTNGGRGTKMVGEFNLNSGTSLKIAVGQQGAPPVSPGTNQYGGGGGSFVTLANNTPLIIAGGGGGSWAQTMTGLSDALTGNNGGAGANGPTNGAGGTGGLGGATAGSADGGGGLTGNGGGTAAGLAFINGATGGSQYGHGGFGGGGGASSWDNRRGCGGGGYSGGGGAGSTTTGFPEGGGGGSYNSGTNQVNTSAIGVGNGTVIIEALFGGGLQCQSTPVTASVIVGPTQPTISVTSQTICSSQTATITASGSPTYTWSTGSNSATILDSPLTSTVYTVQGGVAPCTDTETLSVSVIPTPTIPTVTPNNFTICSSTSTLLNAVSNSTNYVWYDTPGGNTISQVSTYSVVGINTNTNYFVAAFGATAAATGTQTFNFTGSSQTFTVPVGVTQVLIQTWGAEGGGFPISGNTWSGDGGKGGYAAGYLAVTPGQTLQVNVGGFGGSSILNLASGGWNGGGDGWASSNTEPGNGGGGASDVRNGGTALANRIVIAGGGGGGGEDAGDQVGAGGGLTGVNYPAYDATQVAAGAGGGLGFGGTTGQGDGGGGGGGLWGGGTFSSTIVGTDTQGGGGGSGSISGVNSGTLIAGNLTMPSPLTGNITGNSGNGVVKISWVGSGNLCSSPLATVNVTGLVSPTINATATETYICTGTLTSVLSSTGATSYTWDPGNFTGASITVTPNVSTTYTVTGDNGTGCFDTKFIYIDVCGNLPLELISFDVTPENEKVKLEWITETELNTKLFIVERTEDFKSWKEVYSQPAAGFSTQKRFYRGYDENPQIGGQYYRLKTVDMDLSFSYSSLKYIEFSRNITSVKVYPNPTIDKILASYKSSKDINLQIVDVVGRLLIKKSTSKVLEKNTIVELFDISELSPGIYFVKVDDSGLSELIKFIKQ